MAARKRNRIAADVDDFLDRQPKRASYDWDLPLSGYGVSELGPMDPSMGGGQGVVVSTAPPDAFMAAADSMSSRNPGMGLQLSTSGY